MGERIGAIISETDSVIFSGQRHFLSAMYEACIVADGREFPSVEHYYQFWKIVSLAGREAASEFIKNPAPMSEIKRIVRNLLAQYGITKRQTDEWRKNHGPSVLYLANAMKFTQHEDLAMMLMHTENRLLIQAFPLEDYFSAGLGNREMISWIYANSGTTVEFSFDIHNRAALESSEKIANGLNILGIVLMKLREVLKEFYANDGVTNDKILKSIKT